MSAHADKAAAEFAASFAASSVFHPETCRVAASRSFTREFARVLAEDSTLTVKEAAEMALDTAWAVYAEFRTQLPDGHPGRLSRTDLGFLLLPIT